MSQTLSFKGRFNVTLTAQDTEYSLELPFGSKRVVVQGRAHDVRMAFQSGRVASAAAGTYTTVKAASPPRQVDAFGISNLYFASTNAGAVVEVEVYG